MNNKTMFPILLVILIFTCMNTVIAQRSLPPTSHGEYLSGTKYKGSTITFTGNGSHDNDASVGEFTPEWKWDFDYGGNFVPDVTTPNATVTHKYTMAGVYDVALQYFDDDGQAGNIYTFEITIAGHNRYYYVKDHLGSIRVTIDDQGEVASAQDYYAYGEIMADRSYNNSSPNEKYKFTEKERDTETNYDYFGARYYDSEIGRWLAVDPLEDKYPGLSPYNYVANNPLGLIDKEGLEGDDFLAAHYANRDALSTEGQKVHDKTFRNVAKVAALVFIAIAVVDFVTPDESTESGGKENQENEDKKESVYDQKVERNEQGRPVPDPEAKGPHTRLSTRKGEKQGHEFNKDGQLESEISPHDNNKGPHKHEYDNRDPKNPKRGAEHIPLLPKKDDSK